MMTRRRNNHGINVENLLQCYKTQKTAIWVGLEKKNRKKATGAIYEGYSDDCVFSGQSDER